MSNNVQAFDIFEERSRFSRFSWILRIYKIFAIFKEFSKLFYLLKETSGNFQIFIGFRRFYEHFWGFRDLWKFIRIFFWQKLPDFWLICLSKTSWIWRIWQLVFGLAIFAYIIHCVTFSHTEGLHSSLMTSLMTHEAEKSLKKYMI